MTLQEMIESFEELSEEEQISLLNLLLLKRKQREISAPDAPVIVTEQGLREENFWQMTLRFRELMQKEGIEFTDSDFADLRDRSPGREVNFEL
ncbi:MAG: hypothetical protein N5P05_004614 (plasmid) [Chroococcopsis gigantea SAG 12.99]|jgi:hypothetical protein|nr:hypothetical protein [Chroococcopsis gigantea SAG 12.99]